MAGPTVKVEAKPPDDDTRLREVGGLAQWSVSTAKPGNGVDLLRDGRSDTFWQSDGTQPHLINIQFQNKMELCKVALSLDHRLDESYTPARLSVRAGGSQRDLKEVALAELEEPCGWVVVPLRPPGGGRSLSAYLLQLAVLSNHQNGRDTHVREAKVYAPRAGSGGGGGGGSGRGRGGGGEAAGKGGLAVAGLGGLGGPRPAPGGVKLRTSEALRYASIR